MTHPDILKPDAPVLVMGGAGIDIVGRLKGELGLASSTPAQIRSSFGGVARNVAENLARLGQAVRFVSVVGTDADGDQLIQGLIDAGVDVSAVQRTNDFRTSSYLAVINAAGELQFATG